MNLKKDTLSIVTDLPADLHSEEYKYYEKTIPKFPNQAVYIYSLEKKKMLFASGWFDILGYRNDEINMRTIVSITVPRFAAFSNDLNDTALYFLSTITERHEEYSFTLELEKFHKNGTPVPLFSRVGVHKAKNGRPTEIIGFSQVIETLKFGDVMQYAAYGPDKNVFEDMLNKKLFNYYAISRKEKEALTLASEGLSFKEIANKLNVSQSAIEKRIIPMYKRFNVKSLTHLVTFAFNNNILK